MGRVRNVGCNHCRHWLSRNVLYHNMVRNLIRSREREQQRPRAIILYAFSPEDGCLKFLYGQTIFERFRECVGESKFNAHTSGNNLSPKRREVHRVLYTAARASMSFSTFRLSQRPSVELPTNLPFSTITFPRKIVMMG